MASAEDYAAWIVANSNKRGTPEFDTVVAAYKQSKGSSLRAKIDTNLEADRKALDPTIGMSGTDKFFAGAGQAMTNVGRGVGQLMGQVSRDDLQESNNLDAALENTGAGKAGNILGNVAMLAPTAMIPGANTVTGAATIGALTGGISTPGDFADRMKAAAFGGAGGAVGQLIPKAVGVMRSAAEPLTDAGRQSIIGRLMNKTVGDEAPKVAGRLRAAAPLIPGSMPTAAEVSESGGMAALQRAMSAADPEAYAHRGMQQSGARIQALSGIAGDDASMAAAMAARDAASSGLYKQADLGIAPIDATFKALQARPQFQAAIDRATELAKDKGLTDIFFRDPKGKPVGLIGEGAHYVKKALDEAGEFGSKSYTGKASAGAASDTNRIFQEWMSKSIPEYGAAKDAFSAASKPINQMQIGQALLDKMKPALADHGALGRETGASYANALRNGDALAAKATGYGGSTMGDVLDPSQMSTITAIAQDLARKANAQDLGRGVGSNTFQNFAMDNLAASAGVPSAVKNIAGMIPGMSPTMTLLSKGAQGVGGLAYKTADEQIRKDIAQALLNPQAAARLMENAASRGAIVKALQRLPQGVQKAIPPEDLVRALQAMPGVVGMGLANASQ